MQDGISFFVIFYIYNFRSTILKERLTLNFPYIVWEYLSSTRLLYLTVRVKGVNVNDLN